MGAMMAQRPDAGHPLSRMLKGVCDNHTWSADMSRRDRLAARKEGQLDTTAFLKLADKFIDLANRENQKVNATQVHMAFLWGAARYNAFVGKSIMGIEDHEEFVDSMTKEYTEMLRQHLGDETLDPPQE